MNLYTYRDAKRVLLKIAEEDLFKADKLFRAYMQYSPRLPIIGVCVETTNLPKGCILPTHDGWMHSSILERNTPFHLRGGLPGVKVAQQYKKFIHSLPKEQIKFYDQFCFYCGTAVMDEDRTKDHVFPRSRGGHITVWCCKACNHQKSILSFYEFKMKKLKSIKKEFYCEYVLRTGRSDYVENGRCK